MVFCKALEAQLKALESEENGNAAMDADPRQNCSGIDPNHFLNICELQLVYIYTYIYTLQNL